jgi:hypothetical protein
VTPRVPRRFLGTLAYRYYYVNRKEFSCGLFEWGSESSHRPRWQQRRLKTESDHACGRQAQRNGERRGTQRKQTRLVMGDITRRSTAVAGKLQARINLVAIPDKNHRDARNAKRRPYSLRRQMADMCARKRARNFDFGHLPLASCGENS